MKWVAIVQQGSQGWQQASGCLIDSTVDPGRRVNGSPCAGALSALPRPRASRSFSRLQRPPRFCCIFVIWFPPPFLSECPRPFTSQGPSEPHFLKEISADHSPSKPLMSTHFTRSCRQWGRSKADRSLPRVHCGLKQETSRKTNTCQSS